MTDRIIHSYPTNSLTAATYVYIQARYNAPRHAHHTRKTLTSNTQRHIEGESYEESRADPTRGQRLLPMYLSSLSSILLLSRSRTSRFSRAQQYLPITLLSPPSLSLGHGSSYTAPSWSSASSQALMSRAETCTTTCNCTLEHNYCSSSPWGPQGLPPQHKTQLGATSRFRRL